MTDESSAPQETNKSAGVNGNGCDPEAERQQLFNITDEALARAGRRPRPTGRTPVFTGLNAHPAPNVVPRNHPTIAQDTQINDGWNWAQASLLYAWDEGLTFLGYPLLAAMAQRPEYRRIAETIASEMTREWIEFHNTGEEDKSDVIDRLEDAMKRLEVQDVFRRIAEQDGFFGRAHLYIDTGATDDLEELRTSIGSGRNRISQNKVARGALKALRPVEAVWAYPNNYNSTDPLASDWYKPSTWFVMGKEIHASRLLTFVGREVPDLLKPAYQFGGLALSQIVKPYVDNWLRTRTAISDLVHSFATSGVKTNLAVTLQRDGEAKLFNRADFYNRMRDNRGLMLLDKDTEEFFNVSTPLGGLDQLQAQALEHICSACGLPLIKYTGLTPTGLNACLVGGTLIETDAGHIPIRDVKPGHKVMTRAGWAPVAKAGCTAYATELIEIVVGALTLRCTANHPIWLPEINEFAPAANVRPGQLLLCRGVTKRSPRTGDRSHTGVVGGGLARMATIIPGHLTTRTFCFTEKFGECITGLFRRVIRFITRTTIGRTISYRTFSLLKHLSTRYFTTIFPSCLKLKPTLSVNVATAGTLSYYRNIYEPCFAATGVGGPIGGSTESRGPSRNRSVFAAFAEHLSRHKDGTPNIVRENAQPQAKTGAPIFGRITESILRNGCYLRNKKNGGMNCVASVRRVMAAGPVYDIQVEKGYLPEFFADGILVHNSSEGEIRSFYDWISAYQNQLFRENLERVIDFIMLSEFGSIDPCITFEFRSLWQLDDAGKASVQQTKAQIHAIYEEMGAVDLDEVRDTLAHDPDSIYSGIDLSEGAPGMQMPVQVPRMPGAPTEGKPPGIPTAALSGSQARPGAARPGATTVGPTRRAIPRAAASLPAGQTGGIAGRMRQDGRDERTIYAPGVDAEFKEANVKRGGDPKNPGRFSAQAATSAAVGKGKEEGAAAAAPKKTRLSAAKSARAVSVSGG